MLEHPLLFTTEMVIRILTCAKCGRISIEFPCCHCGSEEFCKTHTRRVPIERYRNWKVGDTIWARESYVTQMGCDGFARGRYTAGADWFSAPAKNLNHPTKKLGMIIIPSIHMPRWAARIFLEITGLRVERVQKISEEDTKAEGVIIRNIGETWWRAFHNLWDSINAKRHKGIYAWDKNPEVKVIEFKRKGK